METTSNNKSDDSENTLDLSDLPMTQEFPSPTKQNIVDPFENTLNDPNNYKTAIINTVTEQCRAFSGKVKTFSDKPE